MKTETRSFFSSSLSPKHSGFKLEKCSHHMLATNRVHSLHLADWQPLEDLTEISEEDKLGTGQFPHACPTWDGPSLPRLSPPTG